MQLSQTTRRLAASLCLLLVSVLASGEVGSGIGSGSGNHSCYSIFEDTDNCDFYVQTMNVSCAQLEALNVDCSGCKCGATTTNDPFTATTNEPTTEKPTKDFSSTEDPSATEDPSSTKDPSSTTEEVRTVPPQKPDTKPAEEIAESVEGVIESGELLGSMQQLPALELTTGIKLLNTEVKQDKVDKGDGVVEVQAVVVMSCSVTGYTKETFGQPQQQAFTGLIAEQASVPEDYVQITSIKEQAERRRLRASAYHRELAGSTLLVDFHIRSSPSQEIDEQQPGSSSNSAATLPLAAIIGIVFAVAIVVLVAVAVVMFAVVLPRVRESARSNTHEKEFETDPASFTTTETVLGSPKGIELGPVTRAPDRAMSDSSMAPNAEVKEEIDSQTAVNNADAVTVVTEGPVEPKETPDIAGPENATEGAVELVVETGVNNSVGGDAVVHKIPSLHKLSERKLSARNLSASKLSGSKLSARKLSLGSIASGFGSADGDEAGHAKTPREDNVESEDATLVI